MTDGLESNERGPGDHGSTAPGAIGDPLGRAPAPASACRAVASDGNH